MKFQARSVNQLLTLAFAFFVAFAMTNLANGQTASEYLEKTKAARNDLDFATAFEYANKAVEADKSLWTAYLARAENRYYRDKKRGIGYETESDKAEWQLMIADHLKAAELSSQNFGAYDKLILFLVFMHEKGPTDKPEVMLFKTLNERANTYYTEQISSNPTDVCAYYGLGFFQELDQSRKTYHLAIDKFDGIHGRKCSAEAAASLAKRLLSADGNKETNLAEAKEFYALSLKIDPTVSYTASDTDAFGGKLNVQAASGPYVAPTPNAADAKTPKTDTSAQQASNSGQSGPPLLESAYRNLKNNLTPIVDDLNLQMDKLIKAKVDDAKSGFHLSGMYTGTRRKVQEDLDEIHRLCRNFLSDWEYMASEPAVKRVKELESSYPTTAPKIN